MPVRDYGQLITFAIERDEDRNFRKWIWIDVKVGDTIQKIAARRGHSEDARAIADENKIRSVTNVIRHRPFRKRDRRRVKVPGELRADLSFHVLPQDDPPLITGGYAKFEVIDRPLRVGLPQFTGYDPFTMEVPIRFEAYVAGARAGALRSNAAQYGGAAYIPNDLNTAGSRVEADIQKLERMAGRGQFTGSGEGPPPVIRVATTGANGQVVPLVPLSYQWSKQNPHAPLWRVSGIDWDRSPLRDRGGYRIRQLATVVLTQHLRIHLRSHS